MKWNKTLLLGLIALMALVWPAMADDGEIETYKANQAFDIPLHLSNQTGGVTGATCQIDIRYSNYTTVNQSLMNEMNGGWYNFTYQQSHTGYYLCSQNCTLGNQYTSGTCDFKIGDEDSMSFFGIIFVVLFVIGYYLFVVRSINLDIFKNNDLSFFHSGIKLLFVLLTFWLLLLPVNMAGRYNEYIGGSDSITSNLDMFYQIVLYANYFFTAYFLLWYITRLLRKILEK